ncbi:MAG: hypothetical protein EOM20_11655, partial [Spartobacteria bacterium]|nr:hypothetical protein [Spartobacteria bacterium]
MMDNHFHLLLHSPQEIPSEKNICERYKAFYDGKRVIFPGSPQCKDWQARLLKKAMHDVFDEV